MRNTFGNVLTVTLFGESHGPEIGAVLDGLAPGMTVSEERIRKLLSLRRPAGAISTARAEADEFRIVSGVFEGRTTGTPLTILIPNTNTKSTDYEKTRFLPRPGHADYTATCKYHGFEDYRGGGHFSGRLTAALVAAGGILLPALEKKGIRIGTHIASLGGGEEFLSDRPFSAGNEELEKEIDALSSRAFPVLDLTMEAPMKERILSAKEALDSVGGILETAVTGVPAGLGEPWFDTLEGALSHALFSIPAVKGVEFGRAFTEVLLPGSAYNDAFYAVSNPDGEDSEKTVKTPEKGQIPPERGFIVRTKTNHNGGVNGGITNGMPLVFRTAVKPTPSIMREQETVDLKTGENALLQISGRHDPAIIHRARVVVDCMSAMVLADFLSLKYGTDYLRD